MDTKELSCSAWHSDIVGCITKRWAFLHANTNEDATQVDVRTSDRVKIQSRPCYFVLRPSIGAAYFPSMINEIRELGG